MKKYRQHNDEFKRALIASIDSGEITKGEAARQHDLSTSLIDRWRKQIHNGTMKTHPSPRERQLEKELDKYKKKVGEMTIKIDLLKKLNETYGSTKRSTGYIVTGKNTGASDKDVK